MFNGCRYQIALCRASAEGNVSYYHADAKITEDELTPGTQIQGTNSVLRISADFVTQSQGQKQVCNEAADMCRDNVESPYYFYGGRGTYGT
jgi:hypothetical protein